MRSALSLLLGMLVFGVAVSFAAEPTPIENLGEKLFNDANLSTPPGVACSACHAPQVGFTGPESTINAGGAVYPGAVHVRFGNRKPPAAAYAGQSPVLYYDEDDGTWVGGMFWDGRATGSILGDPLAEQAMGPFLNPLEQDMPAARQVVLAVARSKYAPLFREVWGPNALDPVKDVQGSYERIALSIAAFERSEKVNPFSSKYDAYLKGDADLTDQEALGLELFEGKAMCANCHISRSEEDAATPPLFTDFTYDNLGVPKNPQNPFYNATPNVNPAGQDWIDYGLGGFLASAGEPADVYEPELGKFKVPTLRNVDLRPQPGFVKAYGHNGCFKSLAEIVHFYNTRDVANWPAPEYAATVNHDELGDLGLSADEEAAVVAFLKTLSDGYTPPAP